MKLTKRPFVTTLTTQVVLTAINPSGQYLIQRHEKGLDGLPKFVNGLIAWEVIVSDTPIKSPFDLLKYVKVSTKNPIVDFGTNYDKQHKQHPQHIARAMVIIKTTSFLRKKFFNKLHLSK